MISSTEVSGLKITTILDNLTQSSGPVGHWGFSILLDYDAAGRRRRVLLDTGSERDYFLRNLKELKIDLAGLDAIVLSHGHYDHTSATVDAVEAAGGVKVFAHPSAFSPAFMINEKGERRKISISEGQGLAEIEAAGGQVVLSRVPVEVASGVWTTGEVPRRSFETIMELGRSQLVKLEGGSENQDTIPDDLSIFLREKAVGIVAVTGCAHSGPLNILSHVESLTRERVRVMIGGTHLNGRSAGYVSETIDGLRQFDLQILSPCHCTGFKAMTELAISFPASFVLNYSGKTLRPKRILLEKRKGNL